MKLFFVLGRNPVLSRLEVLSYFQARQVHVWEVFFDSNLLVLDTDVVEQPNIQEFGGVIRCGQLSFEGSQSEFERYVSAEDLIPSDKFTYAVFGNVDPQPLKDKFKGERRKAVLKHGRKQIKMQSGGTVSLPKADYSLFLYSLDRVLFYGLVSQEYNSSSVQHRDMHKPVRRPSLAISPRLAKVLINLSGATRNKVLVDPFCGIGGILQEALVKNVDVFGSDKDKGAVSDAQKNLEWLSQHYDIQNAWKLQVKDAKALSLKGIDAIATETPLGVLVKKRPTDKQAKKMIADFESFIIPILRHLNKVKSSTCKIAITFPAIRRFRVNVIKIAENTSLKVLHKPILESHESQYIGRDIVVFE